MKFTKMQGLGNDYVYVNCFKEKIDNPPELAKFVSDRHFGIGSDGLIMINPSKVADFEMEMYNADGSRGEMCGNGIRCVAKYVYDYGLTDKTHISVATLGGIKYLDLTVKDGKVALVRVDMGEPELDPEKIPIIMKGYSDETDRVLNAPIKVDGKEYHMTGVSMGNPHDVVYIDDVQGLDIEKSDRSSRTMRDFHSGLIQNSQELSTERPWKCVCGREDPARHLHVEPEHVL